MDREREIDKRRIVYLCQRIIAKNIDIILALKEIYELDQWGENFTGEITGKGYFFLYCFMDAIDETGWTYVGNDRSHLSAEYTAKMDKQEKEILEYYEKDIVEFAEETIELLGIPDINQLYSQLTLALHELEYKECL